MYEGIATFRIVEAFFPTFCILHLDYIYYIYVHVLNYSCRLGCKYYVLHDDYNGTDNDNDDDNEDAKGIAQG